MRHTAKLFAIALAFAIPAGLLAQSAYFNVDNKQEKWALNDPFAPKGTKIDSRKAVWRNDELTMTTGDGVDTTRKIAAVTRFEWPSEPAPLAQARDQVERGNSEDALRIIEPVLLRFDSIRKTPGSLWLKAAEIKLDALSGLTNDVSVAAFISTLEDSDDGSIPGLASKIKLAKLNRRVREGDNTSVLIESERLLGEIKEPEMQARLLLTRANAFLALRKYEDALNTYLRVPVFFGSEKASIPAAYLGAAKALRGLDVPATHDQQRLDLASANYLREVIRDFPISKEAAMAKRLLPHEERVAEVKHDDDAVEKPAEEGKPAGDTKSADDAKAPAPETKPAETK